MKNISDLKIPKKYQKFIKEVYHDLDGYWIALNEGYYSEDSEASIIHIWNKADLLNELLWIKEIPNAL